MSLSNQAEKVRSTKSYVVQTTAAVLTCYFLLGGSQWGALGWGIFVVVAVWIVVREVRREAGIDTEAEYKSTNSKFEYFIVFIALVACLVLAIRKESLWVLLMAGLLSWMLFDAWLTDRSIKKMKRKRQKDAEAWAEELRLKTEYKEHIPPLWVEEKGHHPHEVSKRIGGWIFSSLKSLGRFILLIIGAGLTLKGLEIGMEVWETDHTIFSDSMAIPVAMLIGGLWLLGKGPEN